MILSSLYLPPVQYFSKLNAAEECLIDVYENYVKQSYRNRCVIDSPNGALALTLPVEKPDSGKCRMKDIRISDHGDWRRQHWQALVASYYNSPFFEYYQDDFRPFYEQKWEFLVDFNEALMMKCCELIDIQPNVRCTTEYAALKDGEPDYRLLINPKRSMEEDSAFKAKPYYQVFQHKHGFLPNLSVVDLIFNMGPESILLVRSEELGVRS